MKRMYESKTEYSDYRMSLGISAGDPTMYRASPRLDTPISNASSVADGRASARGPISPPPLSRSHTRGATPMTIQSLLNDTSTSLPPSAPVPAAPQLATPPSKTSNRGQGSPKWSATDVATALEDFYLEVKSSHAEMVALGLESTNTPEWRTRQGADVFASLRSEPVAEKKDKTMRIKFKQHLKGKKDQREEHHNTIRIKTKVERVPRYRFHHVEIKKNVLTPNTMLTFVPHLRDLESNEETKYNRWLKELEDIDLKSGFKPMNREEKVILTKQTERSATVSLYLETWLERLAIPNCNKSALIAYMASREPDDAMTPQQKTEILRSQRENNGNILSADARRAAAMFTEGFTKAFQEGLSTGHRVDLRKILLLDESVDGILESKPTAKDGSSSQLGDEDEIAESNLATYSILGCLICFSHACDHGEYDIKNWKRTFSISSSTHMSELLKARRQRRLVSGVSSAVAEPCRRNCFLAPAPMAVGMVNRAWTEDDITVLRSLLVAGSDSNLESDAVCIAANFLERDCSVVYAKLQSLGIALPSATPMEPPRVKALSWYDRRKKMLIGDWQDHTVTHEHQRRDIIEPCSHDGPCAPRVCSCVDAGILCEKWCNCTAETCAYKFTGCACSSLGMTCQSKQKDRPCICIQLNRECDPQLCFSCGAADRADPHQAESESLHATGCQNCDLQRGVSKSLMLGQSQLEGVGYGLFTGEDIAQDDFVIEYVGELITHDEGVRREARRGDVFDEDSNISYVFTLLENEGIWVDAAIYGNLSRYINHASEHDRRGCNITPRILYVNGEYRIKFTAIRDIEAGEELFFNYGENFPNLTKKLLDTKAEEKREVPRNKPGRPPRQPQGGDKVARKAPKQEHKKPGRRKSRGRPSTTHAEDTEVHEGASGPANPRKRKRDLEDDSDEDDYHPSRTDEVGTESGPEAETPSGRKQGKARPGLRARASETPTKRTDRQKTRGKRGGARPGSGRPRKHPRPALKPTAEELAGTPLQQSPARSSRSFLTTSPEALTGSPRASRRGRAAQARAAEVSVIQDSQDDSANDADEDDQDVIVRKRTDRAARNRRPPAKFRDNEP